MLYPTRAEAYADLLGSVETSVVTESRLPDWPFRAAVSNADICQFDEVVGGVFGPVLAALAEAHGDETITLVMFDPSPDLQRSYFGRYPAFRLPAESIADSYWHALAFEPNEDPAGAVNSVADVVVLAGDSGRWSVFAQRDWDLTIVSSQTVGGGWLERGVPFLSAEEALAEFTEPDFKIPLPPDDRATFLRHVRERGTLP